MDDGLLAEHVDAIHGVDRGRFVAERTARVKALRSDGHRDEAAALGRLRKPTLPAWGVNMLARRHAGEVAELLEAGTSLQAAHRRAASGRGADRLRPATRRVRDLAADLAVLTGTILSEAGAGDHRAEVEQTLFAAAVDPDLHDTLRRGVFTRPVEAAGFGDVAALTLARTQPTAPLEDAEPPPPDEAPDPATQRERDRLATRHRELTDRRADLQRALVRRRRRVDQTRAQAEDLQARLEALRARWDEAAQSATSAQTELDSTVAELAAVDDELAQVDAAAADLGQASASSGG